MCDGERMLPFAGERRLDKKNSEMNDMETIIENRKDVAEPDQIASGTAGKVYRISVVRTHYHHYNISVRTRSLPNELRLIHEPTPIISDEGKGLA